MGQGLSWLVCVLLEQKVIHSRPVGQTSHTEFGDIKVAPGHIEAPMGGVMEPRFVERQAATLPGSATPATVATTVPVMPATVIANKPAAMSQMNHPFIKEE